MCNDSFTLYFSLLHYLYGNLEKGVQFEFHTAVVSLIKTTLKPKYELMMVDLLFDETWELVDYFSLACKAFSLNISVNILSWLTGRAIISPWRKGEL